MNPQEPFWDTGNRISYAVSFVVVLFAVYSFSNLSAQSFAEQEGYTQFVASVADSLVVEEVRNANHQLVEVAASSSPKVEEVVVKAKKRKAAMKKLAERNALAFLSSAISAERRNQLPPEVQAEVEKPVLLTGQLQVLHVDDAKNPEKSKFKYFVASNGVRYDLVSATPIQIDSGALISVKGVALDKTVVAGVAGNEIQQLAPASAVPSVGDQKTAVFLIEFTDSAPRPFTREQAKDLVFNSQFQKFYKEQSYGKVSFSGEVFGWYQIQRPGGFTPCLSVSEEEIFRLATENAIDLAAYDRVVILSHHGNQYGGCSTVGKYEYQFANKPVKLSFAWIGNVASHQETSWWGAQPFVWTNLDYLLSHELGHSLGVWHANGWDCDDRSLYRSDCEHVEYGNLFDAMGGAPSYSLHFNAFYKDILGWFSPKNVQTINATAKVQIAPLEDQGKDTVKAVKIVAPGSSLPAYYLEYRRSVGFDANLGTQPDLNLNTRGVLVNKIIPTYDLVPRLIDVLANGNQWWGEDVRIAALPLSSGRSSKLFEDPGRGLSVKTVQAASSTVSVDIKIGKPECKNLRPMIHNTYLPYWQVQAGQYAYFYVEYENGDYFGCGPAQFLSSVKLPKKFELVYEYPPNGEFQLSPEAFGYYSAGIYIPENTPTGKYKVEYGVLNKTKGKGRERVEFLIDVCAPKECAQPGL